MGTPSKVNYSEIKQHLRTKFGDYKFNTHKSIIQVELHRLANGVVSLLEDPTPRPDDEEARTDLTASGKKPAIGAWWSNFTSGVKKVFTKEKLEKTIDITVQMRPDSNWGFTLVKAEAGKANSQAAVEPIDSEFDDDIQIEGVGSEAQTLASQYKLEAGDVIVAVVRGLFACLLPLPTESTIHLHLF